MRAAIMRGGQIVADTFPDPVPQDAEVLVKTLACGICGSDLHALKHADQFQAMSPEPMRMDLARDVVMGHEFCAEIIEHGSACTGTLPVGTRVCSVPITARHGKVASVGYANDFPGGYGELMLLLEPMLLPVKNGLATEHAALTEPMAVGYHAVQKANLQPGEVPLVIGCGPVGLAVIACLNLLGFHPIVAADFSPRRRALAETLGADVVLDPATHSPYESWQDAVRASEAGQQAPVNPLTGERTLPPGVFFECVGVPGIIDQMAVGATPGCRFVIVGVCMEEDRFTPLTAISKELNLQFVLAYTPEEFATTLHHIAEGHLNVAPLITDKVGVNSVANAFDELANPEAHAKILVEPWRE
ncbi:MAG: zinc-binding dehydrogenase [Pseudomonadota bacterium]